MYLNENSVLSEWTKNENQLKSDSLSLCVDIVAKI